MDFHRIRRQQFLSEAHYKKAIDVYNDIIYADDGLENSLTKPESEPGIHIDFAEGIASDKLNLLLLDYTAGVEISSLRALLEDVITSFERYGKYLWKGNDDRDQPIFDFVLSDDYSALMQLVGLCFLLHRRDLLPRIAALQDGVNGVNGGADALFEEFMIHAVGPDIRYQSDYLCALKPYESLFYGLTEENHSKQLNELSTFLKRWYKDLAGCAWHDTHKSTENGDQGGYFGYWSFEAGAAVILLGIEDDSSLHQYLYYPKDLVTWCRAHADEYPNGGLMPTGIIRQTSVRAGEVCPKTGWWLTMAKANSLRYFQQGDKFPNIEGSDYGLTFWQWSPDQPPSPMI